MNLKEEYNELIIRRNNLLREKEINEEKIEKLNKLIDYYTWAYNSCLFEENRYNESISSYKKKMERPKRCSLLDFSFFDTNFDKYFVNRIEFFEKKLEEIVKKKNNVRNIIAIKKRQRNDLIKKNQKIDFYISGAGEDTNDKKIYRKVNFDK